jgi:hypothetical protein
MAKVLRGIIQSRGLGDIIIALPIARHYYDRGEEIVWPICEEFYSSVKNHVPWVNWVSIETDAAGRFFLDRPLEVFKEWGVDPDEAFIYISISILCQNSLIQRCSTYSNSISTSIKQQESPSEAKWDLGRCITRINEGELALRDRLYADNLLSKRYAVCHLTGSSARVDQS